MAHLALRKNTLPPSSFQGPYHFRIWCPFCRATGLASGCFEGGYEDDTTLYETPWDAEQGGEEAVGHTNCCFEVRDRNNQLVSHLAMLLMAHSYDHYAIPIEPVRKTGELHA